MKRRVCLRPLLAAISLACAWVPAGAQTAVELNTKGMALYNQKRYGDAVPVFQQAADKDPTYVRAHYNLACVLAILRGQGKACEYHATPERIVGLLRTWLDANPGRIPYIQEDADLESVRGTLEYQRLLGLTIWETADVKQILQNVTWCCPVWPTEEPARISFYMDGSLEIAMPLVTEEIEVLELTNGGWRVDGNSIQLQLGRPLNGRTYYEAFLSPEGGVLYVDGLPGPFSDRTQECGERLNEAARYRSLFWYHREWWGAMTSGVYGYAGGLEFSMDGTFEGWRLEVDDERNVGAAPFGGSWDAWAGGIRLRIEGDAPRELVGEITEDGVLRIPDLPGPFVRHYFDPGA